MSEKAMCRKCGKFYTKRGMKNHQRACKGAPSSGSSSSSSADGLGAVLGGCAVLLVLVMCAGAGLSQLGSQDADDDGVTPSTSDNVDSQEGSTREPQPGESSPADGPDVDDPPPAEEPSPARLEVTAGSGGVVDGVYLARVSIHNSGETRATGVRVMVQVVTASGRVVAEASGSGPESIEGGERESYEATFDALVGEDARRVTADVEWD